MPMTRALDPGSHANLERAGTVLPALMAILLGVLVVGTVGFSHPGALHDAAHDVRHANGFPCQ